MSRRPPRFVPANRDRNHREIVVAFEEAGAQVVDLAGVGGGVPDLLVGYGGHNYLVEIKDPAKDQRHIQDGELSPEQLAWHLAWPGETVVVHTPAAARSLLES